MNKPLDELCPHCDEVVVIEAKRKLQKCPNCGRNIYPCGLCNMDKVKCSHCPYDKEENL